MRAGPPRGVVWGLAAALSLAACERDSLEECNRLIAVANAHEDRVDTALRGMSGPLRPDGVDALAGVLDHAAIAVGAVPLQDGTLAGYAGRYRRVLAEASRAVRAMLAAQQASDGQGYEAATARLRAMDAEAARLVGQINEYCRRR